MRIRSYASLVFCLGGVILMGMGVYFVFYRPPLLPEDLGFIGVTESELEATIPGIFAWLEKVFSVMGGYIFTSGLLILYIAATSPRRRATDAAVLAVAGLTSIGWMAVVNFIINSDFKWLILAFFLPWVIALGLYRLERR